MAKKAKKPGKRGGFRPGSGRKAAYGEPMEGLYVSLPAAAVAELERRAEAAQVGRIAVLRDVVCAALGIKV